MKEYFLRVQLKEAFQKVDGSRDKKELFRLLQKAEKQGFEWAHEKMYGGGTRVVVYDQFDRPLEALVEDGEIRIDFHPLYFHEKYVPTEVVALGDETIAENMMEEALYGYEMPRHRVIEGYIHQ